MHRLQLCKHTTLTLHLAHAPYVLYFQGRPIGLPHIPSGPTNSVDSQSLVVHGLVIPVTTGLGLGCQRVLPCCLLGLEGCHEQSDRQTWRPLLLSHVGIPIAPYVQSWPLMPFHKTCKDFDPFFELACKFLWKP